MTNRCSTSWQRFSASLMAAAWSSLHIRQNVNASNAFKERHTVEETYEGFQWDVGDVMKRTFNYSASLLWQAVQLK